MEESFEDDPVVLPGVEEVPPAPAEEFGSVFQEILSSASDQLTVVFHDCDGFSPDIAVVGVVAFPEVVLGDGFVPDQDGVFVELLTEFPFEITLLEVVLEFPLVVPCADVVDDEEVVVDDVVVVCAGDDDCGWF